MKPARIDLHIEELVLHGFAPGDRHVIGEAVEHELARLLTERGLASSPIASRESARVNGGDVHIAPDAKASSVGAQVAQAVYGGVTR